VTEIEIRAPITGFVLARNISPGMKFDRNIDLYRIVDLSHVWILADLFENEASFFQPGMKAKIILPQQNKVFQSVVSSVLPQFDPETRTLKVRLEADNPGYVLRPDMFVDVEIMVHKRPTLAVPAEAVLNTGDEKTVYVDTGNGYFVPRQVETGGRFGDKVEIVHGLTQGERIVSSGAFLIDSESRMKHPAMADTTKVAKEAVKNAKDPVCGMDVDPKSSNALNTQHNGQTYYFCSPKCKTDFLSNPGKYVHPRMAAQEHAASTQIP
jgi:RND family efflux transporter MFP subunit